MLYNVYKRLFLYTVNHCEHLNTLEFYFLKIYQMFRYYIFYICFFQLVSIVNSYTLLKRGYHIASYVDNKIYFLGGSTEEKAYTNDFFYLDVSKPFTLDSDLPIVDLSSKSLTYNHNLFVWW